MSYEDVDEITENDVRKQILVDRAADLVNENRFEVDIVLEELLRDRFTGVVTGCTAN